MSKTLQSEAIEAFSDALKSKRKLGDSTNQRFLVDKNYPHVIVDYGKRFGGLQCAEEHAAEYCAMLNAAMTMEEKAS